MTARPKRPPKNLSKFRAAYLDYREGLRDKPPSLERLNSRDRRTAEAFVESAHAGAGIDPYASRPSIEQLEAGIAQPQSSAAASEAEQTLSPPTDITAARKKRSRSTPPP